MNSDKTPLPQATEDFKNRLGITVEIDPAMPKDEIHFVSKSPEGNRIIHRIRLT